MTQVGQEVYITMLTVKCILTTTLKFCVTSLLTNWFIKMCCKQKSVKESIAKAKHCVILAILFDSINGSRIKCMCLLIVHAVFIPWVI